MYANTHSTTEVFVNWLWFISMWSNISTNGEVCQQAQVSNTLIHTLESFLQTLSLLQFSQSLFQHTQEHLQAHIRFNESNVQ